MQPFDKIVINGVEYPAKKAEAPSVFKDKWIASYALHVDLKSQAEFEALVESINNTPHSIIIYKKDFVPISMCLQHKGIVERLEVIETGTNLIRLNLIYTLKMSIDSTPTLIGRDPK